MVYSFDMFELIKTDVFNDWLNSLKDRQGATRINARLDRVSMGNLGDCKPVGEGVSELRINAGPGYRVYFQQHGVVIILILAGGDKATQSADIETAKRLAKAYKE